MNRGSLLRGRGRSILLLYADSASVNSLDRPQFFLGTNSCCRASGLNFSLAHTPVDLYQS